jgi:glucosamine-phosphate N-acetyltransferase
MSDLAYSSLLDLINNNKDSIEDIKYQYLILLSFLTEVQSMQTDEFIKKVEEIFKIGKIIVCHTKDKQKKPWIVGSGTLMLEPKIIRGGMYSGHVEDVVVHSLYRSHGIASQNLLQLSFIADHKCYKVTLDCTTDLQKFYEKNEYHVHGTQMVRYRGGAKPRHSRV